MSQDLVLNLVPFEILRKDNIIHVCADPNAGPNSIRSDVVGLSERSDRASWSHIAFEGSVAFTVEESNTPALEQLVNKALRDHLSQQDLVISSNFIGAITALEKVEDDNNRGVTIYREFSLRIYNPGWQHACKGFKWHLGIAYRGKTEILNQSLSQLNDIAKSISKVVIGNNLKKIEHLTDAEKSDIHTKPVISFEAQKLLGITKHYVRTVNKYSVFYDESLRFYSQYLSGQTIGELFTVFESGFQPISENQIVRVSKDSNLLIFGNGHTHFNPYNGLKSYGPYETVAPDSYRFFFIFHKEDNDYANTLYAYLNRGLKGFPGLEKFVGLDLNLDKNKTITFTQDDPIEEITQQLDGLEFEPDKKYIAVYISRINKDELDPEKSSIYYRLKQVLLGKNISSQVVLKSNIQSPSFNYFLPNIAVAILAKLGGIPWRLSRPVRHDLVIGLGAFRPKGGGVFLGTTVAFRNDGTFVRFDSSQVNSVEDLIEYFRNILSVVQRENVEAKRLVIHFYKKMNKEEEKAVVRALDELGLKIPYIVLNVVDYCELIPFDLSYSGKMPMSGTCVKVRRGDYLLCNNSRYSDVTGARIDDFPYPVRVTVSKGSMPDLVDGDIQQLIDQVYQFSRMYWRSVKQKGEPVTILYSEKVAEISAAFEHQNLPHTSVATGSLWFL